MKLEKFEEAKKIIDEINESKNFLEYFNTKNYAKIYAAEQCGCCTTPYSSATLVISDDPELSKIIRLYIENKIKDLEKQLEEL